MVDFLDVTFDLTLGTYKPYSKPNDTHVYVHRQSNHPPPNLKNIPKAVNKRLSENSSNEEIFNKAAPEYQEALKKSGYDHELKFNEHIKTQKGGDNSNSNHTNSKKRSRTRNVIWFNPPYAINVKTKIGQLFLQLVDKCFPKDGPLGKILNRSTIKISYRTTPNMKQIISSHNKKVLSKLVVKPMTKPCSCPKKAICPLDGKCLSKNIIYKAEVTEIDTENKETKQSYIGLSSTTFKERLGNHIKSFKHEKYSTDTCLSSHIWKIKSRGSSYKVQYTVIDKGQPFNPTSKSCSFCVKEKFYIIYKPHMAEINKRNEIGAHCRHKAMSLFSKTKT